MISDDNFDVEEAHDWALAAAEFQGCTCASEPEVALENDDENGVCLVTVHEKRCQLAFFAPTESRHELIAAREMN